MRGLSAEQAAELLANLCSMPFDEHIIKERLLASRTESEFRTRFAAVLIRAALYAFSSMQQVRKSREETTSLAARFDSELVLLEKRIDELEQSSGYIARPKKRIQINAAFAVLEVVRDLVRTWGELYFADVSKSRPEPQP